MKVEFQRAGGEPATLDDMNIRKASVVDGVLIASCRNGNVISGKLEVSEPEKASDESKKRKRAKKGKKG